MKVGDHAATGQNLVLVDDARAFIFRLLVAYGASEANGRIVAEHLVDSERLGLPSHGVIRVIQYVDEIRAGLLQPSAQPVATSTAGHFPVIDGQWTFGQVGAFAAVDAVLRDATENGMGFATVRRVQHTGRLGAYTEYLAARGMLAMAFATGAPKFHRVAPFGAREGRMSTNPISWAVPTDGRPLVADFATSTIPEGRIRVLRDLGQKLPPDTVCDYQGLPTVEPEDFYGHPDGTHRGFLMPLGGERFGHKGYALGLLAECFSTLMSGDETGEPAGRGNNLSLLALRADPDYATRASQLIDYMKSATPVDASRPVRVPGEPEFLHAEYTTNFAFSEQSWRRLHELAHEKTVPMPPRVGDHGR